MVGLSMRFSFEHLANPPSLSQLMISGFFEFCFGQFLLHSVSGSGEGEGAWRLCGFFLLSTIFQSPSGFILSSFMTRDPEKLHDLGVEMMNQGQGTWKTPNPIAGTASTKGIQGMLIRHP